MRRLINYIRSCFCEHEWELLHEAIVYDSGITYKDLPIGKRWTYRCKKCGFMKTYSSFK